MERAYTKMPVIGEWDLVEAVDAAVMLKDSGVKPIVRELVVGRKPLLMKIWYTDNKTYVGYIWGTLANGISDGIQVYLENGYFSPEEIEKDWLEFHGDGG